MAVSRTGDEMFLEAIIVALLRSMTWAEREMVKNSSNVSKCSFLMLIGFCINSSSFYSLHRVAQRSTELHREKEYKMI
jgi:hypothetical protein